MAAIGLLKTGRFSLGPALPQDGAVERRVRRLAAGVDRIHGRVNARKCMRLLMRFNFPNLLLRLEPILIGVTIVATLLLVEFIGFAR